MRAWTSAGMRGHRSRRREHSPGAGGRVGAFRRAAAHGVTGDLQPTSAWLSDRDPIATCRLRQCAFVHHRIGDKIALRHRGGVGRERMIFAADNGISTFIRTNTFIRKMAV